MTSDPDRLRPTPDARSFHATMEGVAEQPPRKRTLPEDREIDYLICKQCSTPCYVFDMDGGRIVDAQCLAESRRAERRQHVVGAGAVVA